MRADEFARFDAVGLADLVRRRAVSADKLMDAAVDAIDCTNPILNAVVRTDVGRARAAIAVGLPEGRFTGVPFLVKDLDLAAAGTPLTNGSRLFAGIVPDRGHAIERAG